MSNTYAVLFIMLQKHACCDPIVNAYPNYNMQGLKVNNRSVLMRTQRLADRCAAGSCTELHAGAFNVWCLQRLCGDLIKFNVFPAEGVK